ncbi:uncharacterized protein PAC_00407 [Phialocephala subalpina]|uniref:Fungal N-terminal domain-containing protein n=1 Tax=Phialocephala subalpina TaxID=576137 RepID=A0A1L7WCM4_9HELO|nr:uncharacterized protein PAC_00407 [Phialocephala subalpina]
MPVAPLAAVGASVTVVNGTFSLVQTFYKLAAVDEDLKICLELLANANRDLNYARSQLRSRKSSQSYMRFSDSDLDYFESVIETMEAATFSLGQLVQGYKVQRDVNKTISVGSRFKWVLQGKDKFANRQDILRMAHASLLGVINRLGTVAPVQQYLAPPPPYHAPSYSQGPPTSPRILRSPSQQRTLRGKSSMILRSEDMFTEESSMPAPQVRQSGYPPPRLSLPTVPRERRAPYTGYGQSIDAVAEESEFDDYNYSGNERW